MNYTEQTIIREPDLNQIEMFLTLTHGKLRGLINVRAFSHIHTLTLGVDCKKFCFEIIKYDLTPNGTKHWTAPTKFSLIHLIPLQKRFPRFLLLAFHLPSPSSFCQPKATVSSSLSIGTQTVRVTSTPCPASWPSCRLLSVREPSVFFRPLSSAACWFLPPSEHIVSDGRPCSSYFYDLVSQKTSDTSRIS